MKNVPNTEPFEKLWLREAETKSRLANRLFCITFLICNPASSIPFYLAGDPFFYNLFRTHLVSGIFIIALMILNFKKIISGQQMSFYTYAILIFFYAYLLSFPHLSYVQSCLNLTLAIIFAGLVLRWPLKYALIISGLSLTLFPISIYFFSDITLSTFFIQGAMFLTIANLLFPFIVRVSYQKDKREFYFRYALQAHNEELEKQKTIAENVTKAKSNFLSMMSHEIRTPLNGIVGIVHLMMLEETEKKKENELLHTLKFSADHLMAVVNEVLDFNKINSNHVVLDPVPFDPGLLFENLRKTFVPKANEKGIELIFDIDPDLPSQLNADTVRLNQVITNLIHNAIKFTATGSVKFVVKVAGKDDERIWLDFEVIDTGIGIPAEEQSSIFEIFAQAKPTGQRENLGTGLGLAITKELLRLFGGEIALKSEVGKGSVFSFQLNMPYQDKIEQVMIVPEKEMVPATFPHLKVLVADDNKTNLLLATLLLQRRNILFDTASNGQEAFEMFQKNSYGLILMDLRMPVMDGFESTALIRQVNQQIPIVALTASAFEDERERALANGFTGYLIKPFVPEDFYNYIFSFLNSQASNAV
ncbi:MAG: response regulator [Dyadobacter sp.]|uniref:response regulator n=1 Tax=Dyadobacter sp. TaxID=1914288 RepID=UPI00326643D9